MYNLYKIRSLEIIYCDMSGISSWSFSQKAFFFSTFDTKNGCHVYIAVFGSRFRNSPLVCSPGVTGTGADGGLFNKDVTQNPYF